jgi:hypothetical protein
MSPEATKLRLLAKRAERAHAEAKVAENEARRKMEEAQSAYYWQLKEEGICLGCLEPEEGNSHHGRCYITLAQTL